MPGIVALHVAERRARGASRCSGRRRCSGSNCRRWCMAWSGASSLNILAYIGFSLSRAPASIERLQGDLFVPSDLTPISPTFRLWRPAVTIEELSTTVARYLGEERTRTSFDSYASTRGIALDPKAEADFQLIRYAEHMLASAIGAASSRLVLSLLLRKRTVSTKAALKLLDDANAAIHYNREILQTALDHVRQGIAVFNKDLHLICWNRQFGDILGASAAAHAGRHRPRRNPAFQCARATIPTPSAVEALVQDHVKQYVSSSTPFLERVPERDLVMEVRANPMPDGGIVTTFTDITASVKAADELERANETLGTARAGTHRAAHPPQHRARAREGRRRAGQHLEDPLPGRRQPRHPAAAQRRAPVCHQPDRAPGQRRVVAAGRQHRCVARCGRGDHRRVARHFAARYRRHEA